VVHRAGGLVIAYRWRGAFDNDEVEVEVEVEDHLSGFYFEAAGFSPTEAGLTSL
jgi:hypothetical protein